MRIAFTKMHGAANDYIYVNCLDGPPVADERLPDLARQLSERHRGIGSDGMILVLPPPPGGETAFSFRMFNSDGSEGEMCGNGMRCFARYVVARGLTTEHEFTVHTKAGPIRCWVTPAGEPEPWQVTVDLGPPRLLSSEVPTSIAPGRDGIVCDHPFRIGGRVLPLTAVSTGVPHAVFFVDQLAGLPWRQLGREVETHPDFGRRTNVEFVEVVSPERAKAVVWERGAGETLACGTGACAVVVAGVLTGRLARRATVGLPGGDLSVEWRLQDGHVLLSGPAVEVCRGEFICPSASF
jgi:diaminopimelate epimerase